MPVNDIKPYHMVRTLLRTALRFIGGRSGNIGVMTAILIVPLIGAMGLATEGGSWFLINRAAQHAADSAALAAAINNDAAGATCTSGGFISEARAVTSNLGFTHGSNNTTVSVCTETIAAIPKCASTNCYVVTVTHNVPLLLSSVLGYNGDVALGAGRGTQVQAVAVARSISIPGYYCITSLGTTGNPIRIDGGPDVNFTGCVLRSNGNTNCNGNNADGNAREFVYGPAGSAGNCEPSAQASSNLVDPYSTAGGCGSVQYPCYGSNIPAAPAGCGGANPYNYEATSGNPKFAASLPAGSTNRITSLPSGTTVICGDAALFGDVIVPSGRNAVLVLENGVLDLNGHTLQTASTAGLTVVFSGDTKVGAPVDNSNGSKGVLDIAAPTDTSNAWHGVALWQDASLTSGPGINFTLSGSSPTMKITGLVYMPNATVTISGAIDHATNGAPCFALLDNQVRDNGTGSIFAFPTSGCSSAGLTPPQGVAGNGAELVF